LILRLGTENPGFYREHRYGPAGEPKKKTSDQGVDEQNKRAKRRGAKVIEACQSTMQWRRS
jgi:hypothetical protein